MLLSHCKLHVFTSTVCVHLNVLAQFFLRSLRGPVWPSASRHTTASSSWWPPTLSPCGFGWTSLSRQRTSTVVTDLCCAFGLDCGCCADDEFRDFWPVWLVWCDPAIPSAGVTIFRLFSCNTELWSWRSQERGLLPRQRHSTNRILTDWPHFHSCSVTHEVALGLCWRDFSIYYLSWSSPCWSQLSLTSRPCSTLQQQGSRAAGTGSNNSSSSAVRIVGFLFWLCQGFLFWTPTIAPLSCHVHNDIF